MTRMDVVGEGGVVLRDQWAQGVSTYLGVMSGGFPNFFMAGGPHLIAGNFPRATEIMVDYITGVLTHARANRQGYIAPEPEACALWTEEVHEAAKIALIAEKSWFRGANIPGKANEFLPYAGSLTKFRQRMLVMDEQGYPGIAFGNPVRV